MLGRQNRDDITTPLTRAGTLIELRRGGHRVYWKGKGKEVTEEFPQCDDKGFHALMSIGWYEMGELPPGATGADSATEAVTRKPKSKTTDKRKRRGRKRVEEEEDEFDDGEYDTDDEPDAFLDEDTRSDDESDDVGVQCYKEF